MEKKVVVDDDDMYVKLKAEASRIDVYFNRKGCDKKDSGHFVMKKGEVAFNRTAPALKVIMINGYPYVSTSRAITYSIPTTFSR